MLCKRETLHHDEKFSNLQSLAKIDTSYDILLSNFAQLIGLVGRVFVNDPGDQGSIPARVIPKTLKIAVDTPLLNTQHYKVRIKGKVEKSGGRMSALPYTLV